MVERRTPLELLGAALAPDDREAACVELEQVSHLIVSLGGGGVGKAGRGRSRTADVGRGGDEFEQIQGDIFVAASGAGQCGGLLHMRPPKPMLPEDWLSGRLPLRGILRGS